MNLIYADSGRKAGNRMCLSSRFLQRFLTQTNANIYAWAEAVGTGLFTTPASAEGMRQSLGPQTFASYPSVRHERPEKPRILTLKLCMRCNLLKNALFSLL
jgi:hypothetical protein